MDRLLYASEPTSYHYPLFRLGRVYMNYAEALLRLNQPADAIAAINKTREAHGGLPALPPSLSVTEAWQYYKIERRVELLLEDDRFWSLLRWGKEDGGQIIGELNKPLTGLDISEDGREFSIVELPFDKIRSFSPKRYLFPIPQAEIQNNEKLEQNNGW